MLRVRWLPRQDSRPDGDARAVDVCAIGHTDDACAVDACAIARADGDARTDGDALRGR